MTKEEVVYVIINGGILEAHSTDCVVSDGIGSQMDEYAIKGNGCWFESKHASNYRIVDQDGKRIQGEVSFIRNVTHIKPTYVYVRVDMEDCDEHSIDVEAYCSDIEIQDDYC